MDSVQVLSRTQRIIVQRQEGLHLNPGRTSIRIVDAGPIGPHGMQGIQGPPGDSAETAVGVVMDAHINDTNPHPVYDDIPDLTILLENGLF